MLSSDPVTSSAIAPPATASMPASKPAPAAAFKPLRYWENFGRENRQLWRDLDFETMGFRKAIGGGVTLHGGVNGIKWSAFQRIMYEAKDGSRAEAGVNVVPEGNRLGSAQASSYLHLSTPLVGSGISGLLVARINKAPWRPQTYFSTDLNVQMSNVALSTRVGVNPGKKMNQLYAEHSRIPFEEVSQSVTIGSGGFLMGGKVNFQPGVGLADYNVGIEYVKPMPSPASSGSFTYGLGVKTANRTRLIKSYMWTDMNKNQRASTTFSYDRDTGVPVGGFVIQAHDDSKTVTTKTKVSTDGEAGIYFTAITPQYCRFHMGLTGNAKTSKLANYGVGISYGEY